MIYFNNTPASPLSLEITVNDAKNRDFNVIGNGNECKQYTGTNTYLISYQYNSKLDH